MADIEHDDGLTEEERAALADDDGTETEGGTDDKGADGGEGGEPAAAASEEPALSRDDGTDPVDEVKTAPILVAEPPADADDKLKEIATKKEELITQFDDGDITAKEYQQQLDALSKQEREVELAIHKANMAAEMEQQRQRNEWTSTVNSFIEANPVYKDTPRLYRALDQEVRDVASSEEGKTMSGAKILAKAHQNLAEAFGLQTAKPTSAKAPKADAPPSLHGVPAADANDVTGGKYAALDRLASTNPIAYEEALMKLSDSERDSYLASL
jgi:hypothetical protein